MEKNKLCPSGSVGAVIKKNGKYLVLYRKIFPQGLAFVAGHTEEGESPEESFKREVFEETGLDVKSYDIILRDTFSNPCKRGYTKHEWHVYRINEWEGEPKVMEPDKHKFVKFMNIDEIKDYAQKNDFDPAWILILKRLNIL